MRKAQRRKKEEDDDLETQDFNIQRFLVSFSNKWKYQRKTGASPCVGTKKKKIMENQRLTRLQKMTTELIIQC